MNEDNPKPSINPFSATIESLYSVRFYRDVIQSSISKGFLYLTFWTALASCLITIFVAARVYPEAGRFMDWVKAEMPVIEWTVAGAKIDKPSPYVMKHPRYGHIATFDMSKTDLSSAEIGDAMFYMTSTRLYLKESANREVRMYDLTKHDPDIKPDAKVVINAQTVEKFEKAAKPAGLVLCFFFAFIIFFIWKLLAAVFYSTLGLILNRFRTNKLSYEAVLNVSFFALTASIWIGILSLYLSSIVRIPFGFFGSVLVTSFYLLLGIKLTEDPSPPIYT